MALARTDPLPLGVYWIDVFRPFGTSRVPDGDVPFRTWVEASKGQVNVLRRELSTVSLERARLFYVFEVTGPVPPFPRRELGSPTVQKLATQPGGVTNADRTITSDDTAQKPEPQGLGDFLASLEPTLERYAPLIALGVVLYLWSQSKPRSYNVLH